MPEKRQAVALHRAASPLVRQDYVTATPVVHVTPPYHSTQAQRAPLPKAKLSHEQLSELSKVSAG